MDPSINEDRIRQLDAIESASLVLLDTMKFDGGSSVMGDDLQIHVNWLTAAKMYKGKKHTIIT